MKGEQPHCGFPEKNYAANAERLARAGHRVVVVEQTETPAQLAERKAADKSVKDSVVMREKVAVLTRGTLVDTGMTDASPDAAFCVAIFEPENAAADSSDPNVRWMGVCAADCATGRFLVGAWPDDTFAGGLRGALAALRPVEIVSPPGGVSDRVTPALRDATPDATVRSLSADAAKSLHPDDVIERLHAGGYFEKGKLPDALEAFQNSPNDGEKAAALGAFGVMAGYLSDAMIDRDLIPLGRVEALPGPEATTGWTHGGFMALDAAALTGLEVLEGSDGGAAGSLLNALDRCAGAMGRRLLRRWVCRPLRSAAAIASRQAAVKEMRSAGIAGDAVAAARKILKAAPDLERCASRLVGQSGGRGRDAANVVLYEDAARAKLQGFLRALEGAKSVRDACGAFDGVRSRIQSEALSALVTEGGDVIESGDAALACGGASTPELSEHLAFFERAFDWEKARESGRIEPKPGADEAVDAADDRVNAADEALDEWLNATRRKLGASMKDVNLVSANKDTHLCEVSDKLAGKVPGDWSREGKRKGFEKFDCPELKELRAEREAAGDAREAALENVLRVLVAKFCDEWPRWRRAAEAAAALDALSSLAEHADEIAGSFPESCTPTVTSPTDRRNANRRSTRSGSVTRAPPRSPPATRSFPTILNWAAAARLRFCCSPGPTWEVSRR
jgi:DNA mismatch repair protein MSH6